MREEEIERDRERERRREGGYLCMCVCVYVLFVFEICFIFVWSFNCLGGFIVDEFVLGFMENSFFFYCLELDFVSGGRKFLNIIILLRCIVSELKVWISLV